AERKREGALASVVHETLGTLRMSRGFAQEDVATRKFHVESAARLERGLAAAVAGEGCFSTCDVLGGGGEAMGLVLGCERVMELAITRGSVIVFVSYVRSLYKSLKVAAKHATKLTKAGAQVERVAELLDVEEGVTDRPGAHPAPPIHGTIEFRGVRFEYE